MDEPRWAVGYVLKAHANLHCCVTDGMFGLGADGTLLFHPAAALDAGATSAVHRRIAARCCPPRCAMVRIEADDRAGLERLVRYCARLPKALPSR